MRHALKTRLQLLVDGELAPRDIDQVLDDCELEPEAWKQLALQFLERQQFESLLGGKPDSYPSIRLPEAATKSAGRELPKRAAFGGWLVIAAGLFLALTVGFALGRVPQSRAFSVTARSQSADGASVAVASDSAAVSPAEVTSNLGERTAEDSIEPGTRPTPTPFYVVAPAAETGPSNAERYEWLKQGYVLRETPRWVRLKQGNQQLAVPDPQYNLTYVGGLAYQ